MSHDTTEAPATENVSTRTFSPPNMPTRPPLIGSHEVDQGSKVISEHAHLLRLVSEVEAVLAEHHNTPPVTATPEESEGAVETVSLAKHSLQSVGRLLSPTAAHAVFFRPENVELQRKIELEIAYAELAYILNLLKRVQRTIVVMASKGGAGKTPLITNLAVLHAWLANCSNLVVEGNENDGTANLRLDLRRSEQVLLNDVLADHDLISDHNTACDNLGKHKQTSVYALLSDANSTNNKFTMEEFLSMYQTLRPKYRNGFGDTGNGNSHAANEGLFLEADVVLFPAVRDDKATFNTLLSTMINLYQLKHVDKLRNNSFIVINGTHEGDTVAKFLKRFYAVAAEMVAPQIDHKTKETKPALWTNDPVELLRNLGFAYDDEKKEFTGEKIYMVPYSQWIRDGKPVSVLPEETGLETLVAYARILVDCFKLPSPTPEEKKAHITRRIKERNEPTTLVDVTQSTTEALIIQRIARSLEGTNAMSLEPIDVAEIAAAAAKKVVEEMLQPAS